MHTDNITFTFNQIVNASSFTDTKLVTGIENLADAILSFYNKF